MAKRFVNIFAGHVADGDYLAAHRLLTDWMQKIVPPEKLKFLLEHQCKAVTGSRGLEQMLPRSYSVEFEDRSLAYFRGLIGAGIPPRGDGSIAADDFLYVNWGYDDNCVSPIPKENTAGNLILM